MNKIFDEIKLSGKLPSPSGVGMRILRLTQTEDNSLDEIIKVVRSDPSLTGRILKVANLGTLAGVPAATTLEDAVLRLGFKPLRDLILGFSLVGANSKATCKAFDYGAFWHASVGRAVAAQHLTQLTGRGSVAEAYICGLLCGMGRLALATVHPEAYGEVLRQNDASKPDALADIELRQFGINHRELTEGLLVDWGFPKRIAWAAAYFQQSPTKSPTSARRSAQELSSILLLAESLIALPGFNGVTVETLPETIRTGCAALEINVSEVVGALGGIQKIWAEMNAMLNVRPPPGLLRKPALTPAEPRDLSAPTDSSPASGLPKLLLVESADKLALELEAWLKPAGYEVIRVRSAQEALPEILARLPQIVIAHGQSGDAEALKICQAMRAFEEGRRMIFLLAVTHHDTRKLLTAFDAGVDDYLTLPCGANEGLLRLRAVQRLVQLRAKVADQERSLQKNLSELAVANRKLHRAALTDQLTQLPNRRFAEETMREEWETASACGTDISLIVAYIDHFKKVNDTHGHLVGDIVLAAVAKVFHQQLRETDVACRLGGEEFLVICRETSLEEATVCAERLRATIAAQAIVIADMNCQVTISLGVASRRNQASDMASVELLLKAADDAAYQAKRTGRDRVCCAPAKKVVPQNQAA